MTHDDMEKFLNAWISTVEWVSKTYKLDKETSVKFAMHFDKELRKNRSFHEVESEFLNNIGVGLDKK